MSIRSFLLLFILASFSLLLSSCQDRKPAIDTFGELDSLKVASDTTMQVNMDRSYEYQKSLVESDSVVYDFLAYDKPKGSSSPDWESKFIVIRRTKFNQDTVIKDNRSGIIQSTFLADINENGRKEVLFYEYPKHDAKPPMKVSFFVCEMNGRNKVQSTTTDFKFDDQHYKGRDSFFINENYIIRRSPYYSKSIDSPASGMLWQSYKISGGRLVLAKEKMVNN
jgi:hypothetical protein